MIAFRLDANSSVATGHMFRCISIAKQCRKEGKDCIFLLAEEEYTEVLDREGFPYCVMNIKWDDWNYGIDVVEKCLKEYQAECLVVDSYRVTSLFFQRLIKEVPIFYLDDLCTQPYELSAVLHYSEWEQEHILADLYEGTHVKVYSGMKYMPLRDAFEQTSSDSMKKYELLITTGGSDTYHITQKLLQALIENPVFQKKLICAVLGKMNTDKEEIDRISQEHSNITVLQNISNMDEVMRQCRYAVTAGGTSVYELMASGVPFVCFGFSDDQKYFGERLEEYGNALWAGDAREGVDALVSKLLDSLEKMSKMDCESEQALIQRNRALIDGKGAARIADIIIDLCQERDKKMHKNHNGMIDV